MFAIILIVIVSLAVVTLLTFEIIGLIRQIKENRKKKKGVKVDSPNPTLQQTDDETPDNTTENKED